MAHRRKRLQQQRPAGRVEIDATADDDVVDTTVGTDEASGGKVRLRHDLAARSVVRATLEPVLGMLGAAPYFFIEGKIHLREEILTSLTGAFAFYMYIVYVSYAEEVTAEVERGVETITTRGALRMMREAWLVAPSAMAAAVAAIIIPRASIALLVVPGLWVLTRWSLFAPVISREHLGPVAALRRSNEVVRGHFELVFLTATLAAVLEEVAVHAGGVAGLKASGSDTWGQWLGSSVAIVLSMPMAAFATSVTYIHLMRHTR